MSISRREFLIRVAAGAVASQVGALASAQHPENLKAPGEEQDPLERILREFLASPGKVRTDRETIKKSLFEVRGPREVEGKEGPVTIMSKRGMAMAIDDKGVYFITANHMVDEKPDELIIQTHLIEPGVTRTYAVLRSRFEVVARDEKADLALLRRQRFDFEQGEPGGVVFSMSPEKPSPGEVVSRFERPVGVNVSDKEYNLVYGGSEFYEGMEEFYRQHGVKEYDPKRVPLGKSILPAGKSIMEERGMVIPYRQEDIRRMYPKAKDDPNTDPSISALVTTSSFNGDSGSPVFRRVDTIKGEAYEFVGILTEGYGRVEWIETPGHPGHGKMQHVVTQFTHRDAIERFLRRHLEERGKSKG
ncbi:MAG: hypothetical protein ABIH11_03305 [Candidatus Altiarchaeota archaeon]